MALKPIEVEEEGGALPSRVAEFIAAAEERILVFLEGRGGAAAPAYVSSDFPRVYRVLASVARRGLASGMQFLETGSGFGVVSGLASMLGFEAAGIEINDELVDEAEALAEEFDLRVEYGRGTFVPPGGSSCLDQEEEFAWLTAGGPCGYEALGLDLDDFDVVYSYPWPGEERVIERIFDRFGAEGALLVSYHGIEEIRVRRKMPRRLSARLPRRR